MATEWYYAKDNQQMGPVPPSQLKMLAQGGQLSPEDLVWKEGMSEWQPAGKIKGLFDPGTMPAAATAVARAGEMRQPAAEPAQPYGGGAAQPQAYGAPQSSIGYYNPTAGLGARTANIMKGYATPTGPSGEWPLSDQHLEQLKEAERHRKSIRAAASLFNLMFALQVIGLVLQGLLLVLVLGAMGAPRGQSAAELGMQVAFGVGFAVLYYFTSRHTMRCQIWAPITMLVLFTLGVIGLLLVIVGAASFSGGRAFGPDGGVIVFIVALVLIIPAIFIYLSVRAIIAIPKFRASPVWCQEALINAKL